MNDIPSKSNKRRLFSYSIRFLLFLFILPSIFLAWVSIVTYPGRREKSVTDVFEKSGAHRLAITYDYQAVAREKSAAMLAEAVQSGGGVTRFELVKIQAIEQNARPPGNPRLRKFFGDNVFARVKHVSAFECDLSKIELQQIHKLEALEHLSFGGCNAARDLEWLRGMNSLKGLSVQSLPNLSSVDAVESLEGLSAFSISSCSKVRDFSAIGGVANLKTLSFAYCQGLGDLDFFSSSDSAKSIETLRIAHCNCLTNFDGIDELSQLKVLNCNKVAGLVDLNFISKNTSLINLEALNLARNQTLADISAIKKLPDLKKLQLNSCWVLKDISAIAELESLELLVLSDCRAIEDFQVLKSMTGLKELNVSNCPTLTFESLSQLRSSLENTIIKSSVANPAKRKSERGK